MKDLVEVPQRRAMAHAVAQQPNVLLQLMLCCAVDWAPVLKLGEQVRHQGTQLLVQLGERFLAEGLKSDFHIIDWVRKDIIQG